MPRRDQRIVIFDGVCNFCNGAVRFISKRDPDGRFLFSPMQSDYAQALVKEHGITNVGVDTFLLIKDGKAHIWSDAAMEIARDLTGLWFLFNGFRIIPAAIRDYFYRVFARNRYFLFGQANECEIPPENLRSRFMGC